MWIFKMGGFFRYTPCIPGHLDETPCSNGYLDETKDKPEYRVNVPQLYFKLRFSLEIQLKLGSNHL